MMLWGFERGGRGAEYGDVVGVQLMQGCEPLRRGIRVCWAGGSVVARIHWPGDSGPRDATQVPSSRSDTNHRPAGAGKSMRGSTLGNWRARRHCGHAIRAKESGRSLALTRLQSSAGVRQKSQKRKRFDGAFSSRCRWARSLTWIPASMAEAIRLMTCHAMLVGSTASLLNSGGCAYREETWDSVRG